MLFIYFFYGLKKSRIYCTLGFVHHASIFSSHMYRRQI